MRKECLARYIPYIFKSTQGHEPRIRTIHRNPLLSKIVEKQTGMPPEQCLRY